MKIPVHLVCGAPGSGKSALIARLVQARSNWLGLVNARAHDAQPPLHPLPQGCPCCTGRVVLQATLTRLLRQHHPERVLIELTEDGHEWSLDAVLTAWPLSQYVLGGRPLRLPADARLSPQTLEAQ